VVITVILLGGLVIALVALQRLHPSSGTEPVASEHVDPTVVEREVYEKLYGKRSTAVSAPVPRKPSVDPTVVEREVYEKLYGKRSTAVSAPVPRKPSPGAQADGSRGQKPSGKWHPAVRGPREHPV
jgi:hypothetical protein